MQQTVTDSFDTFLATVIRDDISRLVIGIGTGDPSWDTQGLPDVTPDTSSLFGPVAFKPVESIDFLDGDGNVSQEPTSVLSISSQSFTAEDFEGAVRECGLLYVTGDSSVLVMYSVFSRIEITPQVTLTKNLILRLGSPPV